MNWFTNIYHKYLSRSIVEKIIVINIILFVLTYFFNTLSFLFKVDENLILEWFSLQPEFDVLLYKPWTIVSYGFLHIGFFHILFNLLVLFYFGNLFLESSFVGLEIMFEHRTYLPSMMLGLFFLSIQRFFAL